MRKMTTVLHLIRNLDNSTPRAGVPTKLKPRRQRRQEMRDRDRAAKLNAK
jgi:hypothetical protein